MIYDYVVIGAGVSGMTAALIMAKHGYKVALVEKSPRPAPTIRGFTRKGVFFDTGFHYAGSLGAGGALHTLLTYLGITDAIETVPFKEDGFDSFRCLTPPFRFDHPYGYGRIMEKFHKTFPGEQKAIDNYFSAVREQYNSIPYVNLDTSLESATLARAPETTLQAFLDGITDNGILKCILSMHCFLYGVAPDESPFANHANVAGSYYESVSGVAGGGSSLVHAFEAQLEKMGVEVYCGAEATGILLSSDGALSGVILKNGTTLNCTGCISTIHPRSLLDMVPDRVFRPAYGKRLRALDETASACILYASCSEPIAELAGSNLFIFPEPDFLFFHEKSGIEKRPMYITGAGGSGVSVKQGFIAIIPVSREETKPLMNPVSGLRSADYKNLKEAITEKMVKAIGISCPEIAATITDVTTATPLTLRDYTNSPFGSLYGVKHRVGQVNPMPATRLKGLFVAGQAVTAPGVMGAAMSGFLVGGSIIGHDKLQKELRQCRREG